MKSLSAKIRALAVAGAVALALVAVGLAGAVPASAASPSPVMEILWGYSPVVTAGAPETISGWVYGPNQVPDAGVPVALYLGSGVQTGTPYATTFTNANGVFHLTYSVPRPGRIPYRITVGDVSTPTHWFLWAQNPGAPANPHF